MGSPRRSNEKFSRNALEDLEAEEAARQMVAQGVAMDITTAREIATHSKAVQDGSRKQRTNDG